MRRNRLSRILALFLVLVLVAGAIVFYFVALGRDPLSPSTSAPQLLITMLDVGQADSIILRTSAGKSMLIDAGNESADAQRVILPYLKKQGITFLDYVVLTHPDQDHVGGMPAVLNGIAVSTFVDSVQPGQTGQAYLRTLQEVQRQAIKPMKARRGEAGIGLGEGIGVEVLGPEEPLITEGSPTNNNSVVLRITAGPISALLTGDIGQEAEARLLSHHDNIRSQILKVAHHGSSSSSSSAFLQAVHPEAALISVGAGNSYGHPAAQTLQRLQRLSTKVYRTDVSGTIEVAVDGASYTVNTEKARS